MPKPKRKYTFRKGKMMAYESGSLIHQLEKAERESYKPLNKLLKRK